MNRQIIIKDFGNFFVIIDPGNAETPKGIPKADDLTAKISELGEGEDCRAYIILEKGFSHKSQPVYTIPIDKLESPAKNNLAALVFVMQTITKNHENAS